MDTLPLCRVCTQSSMEYIDLESPLLDDVDGLTFLDGFNACTRLNASLSDEFPKNLCVDCGSDLRIAYLFVKRAIEADAALRNIENSVVAVKMESEKFEEEVEIPKEEINTSEDENEHIDIMALHPGMEYIDYESESEQIELEFDSRECTNSPTKLDGEEEEFEEAEEEAESENEDKTQSQFEPSNKKLRRCEHCPKWFFSEDKYKQHLRAHQSETFECNMCHKAYKSKYLLKRHLETVHRDAVNNPKVLIECKICKKSINYTWYPRHMERVHCDKSKLEKPFLCDICPKAFISSESLKRHIRVHSDKPAEIKYNCEQCGKGFSKEASFKVHLKIHDPDRPKFPCEICGRTFSFIYGLAMHKKIHAGGEYECPECLKKFVRKSDLEIHMRFHTGDYPFQCEYCEKRFAIRSHWKDHTQKHLGITFKCNLCPLEFRNSGTLRVHKYQHSTMPFNCSECGKGFDSRYKVRRHLLTVHKVVLTDEEYESMYPRRNVVHLKGIDMNEKPRAEEIDEPQEEESETTSSLEKEVSYILMTDE